ncbi:MAG: dihydrodipicolinate synthase family protein [bacterium]|nr:dihydrodipicolinate synthase family protein [bacterium]
MRGVDEFREALTGPVASVSTPFTKDGDIDANGLRTFIDRSIEGGTKTVMLTYGDSLYSVLTDDEIGQVTRLTVDHTAGRAMVIAAEGIWPTRKTVDFARYCRDLGADLLMVLPPDWAESCTMDTLVEHHAAVGREMPVMIVTNWLAPRPHSFSIEFLNRVADEVPGVVAVKDDLCGNFARKMGLAVHDRLALVSGGQKQNHLNNWPYGCDGYLTTFGRFRPEIAQQYWRTIEANDVAAATAIIRDFDIPLFDFIMTFEGGFDAALHGALELFGIAGRWRRKPYYSLNDAEMERLAAWFRDKGLL